MAFTCLQRLSMVRIHRFDTFFVFYVVADMYRSRVANFVFLYILLGNSHRLVSMTRSFPSRHVLRY